MFQHSPKTLVLQLTQEDRAALRKLGHFMGIRKKTLPHGRKRSKKVLRPTPQHPIYAAPLSTILRTCLQRAGGSSRFHDQLTRRICTATVPPGPFTLRSGPGRPPLDGRPKRPKGSLYLLKMDPAEYDALAQRARDCAYTAPSNYVYATLNLMVAALKRDGVWDEDTEEKD